MIIAGCTVTWDSQAGGSWKTKTGKLLGYVQPEQDAKQWIPKLTPNSQIKFQSRSSIERAVVEVPRSGKSVLCDYYAPRATQIKEETDLTIQGLSEPLIHKYLNE